MRNRWLFWLGFLSSVAALSGFAYIVEASWTPTWLALEESVALPVIAWRTPGRTCLMQGLSLFGSTWILTLIVTVVSLGPWANLTLRDRVAFPTLALAASALCSFLKFWFSRPRPGHLFSPLLQEPYYSLPSGHSVNSFCVYIFLAYLIASHLPTRAARGLILGLALSLVLAIGLSRVYLGVHYPGDVLAGYALAWICVWLAIMVHRQELALPATNRPKSC